MYKFKIIDLLVKSIHLHNKYETFLCWAINLSFGPCIETVLIFILMEGSIPDNRSRKVPTKTTWKKYATLN